MYDVLDILFTLCGLKGDIDSIHGGQAIMHVYYVKGYIGLNSSVEVIWETQGKHKMTTSGSKTNPGQLEFSTKYWEYTS